MEKRMDMGKIFTDFWGTPHLFKAACDYTIDSWQRSILFTDIMCKRGNMYLKHVLDDQPPVLVFDYEMVMDGRTFARPVNYAIVRILDRRSAPSPRKAVGERLDGKNARSTTEKREAKEQRTRLDPPDREKRPIVVIDPRAGHGPGIGGSKLDSQIGVALNGGHPVYFVMFFTEPEPGQTLSDVQQAEVRFLEEVINRHPEAELPAVIGNCQAGWATALIGADRPDVTGPMVFNGSPLSYWGGVDGANPMRYKGGLCGGVWLTSLWCDLGNGIFDGANLVAGFEDLNPANTFWTKQYNLYAKVDTEEERYLNFEKWWGGFFKMNREEIHFIVDSLFVGNELEQGKLRLDEDRWVNLKHFKDPIVVFASQGDNITPPQQALNWIYKVYKTVDEIKRNGQVIVYIVHPKIGHLGIFVGSKIAKKEHTAIIGTVDMIEYLSPGLYEMVITDNTDSPKAGDHFVEFQERTMEDILALDDELDDEDPFNSVAAISRVNDRLYLTFLSPWVRMMTNEMTAECIRQLHPLRMQRYLFSDLNPWLWPFKFFAPLVKEQRQPVAPDNPFVSWEKSVSKSIETALNEYRDYRDLFNGRLFRLMYDNDWMKDMFPPEHQVDQTSLQPVPSEKVQKIEHELWLKVMQKGGFEAAVVRIVLAVSAANSSVDQRQFFVTQMIIQTNERLKHLKPADLKRLVKEQAGIVAYDRESAIKTLPKLLPKKADRIEVFEIANSVATANLSIDEDEQAMLDHIKEVLKI